MENKKKTSIKAKMLLGILPVVVIAVGVLTLVSARMSRSVILEQTIKTNEAQLDANVGNIDGVLETIRTTALLEAQAVGATYTGTDMNAYAGMFSRIISANDVISGSGIWFEPYAFDNVEEYMGPYWYRDGSAVAFTLDYSNAEYDYFSQEYYLNAKALKESEALITDPYYDETSDTIMATCSAPIYNSFGKYIGCVTVDITLDSIEAMVGSIQVGETGRGMLVTTGGTYLYTDDASKVANGVNITADPNASLASAARTALSSASGETSYTEGGKAYTLFYKAVPEVGWKLLIRMESAEITKSVNALIRVMLLVGVIALLIAIVVILLLVQSIATNLNRVKTFAGSLAAGDFTIDRLSSKQTDELGQMSSSLNDMFENNRNVLTRISAESENIGESSANLNEMAGTLSEQFESIRANISGVNDAMMSSGAATQEVNASVEEVNASVQALAHETDESREEARQIIERAAQIEAQGHRSQENARRTSNEREQELLEARAKAKVVDEIGSLADSIEEIASQIDLLSLNASIEAARAGEHGKGFAVVASEINKLASETSEAVGGIKSTIEEVQSAFSMLMESANALLKFLKETVGPDYDTFVNVGIQYGKDAESFGSKAEKIAEMAGTIRTAVDEVSEAVQNIADSTQDTAERCSNVSESVNSVADVVDGVSDMSEQSRSISMQLKDIVGQFKLK